MTSDGCGAGAASGLVTVAAAIFRPCDAARVQPVAWTWWPLADAASPKIFNASREARGGDIISIQGANFELETKVLLDGPGGSRKELPVVNRVGEMQMAVQLPATLADPVIVHVTNSHGTSEPLRLNAARPQQLDATRLAPGGRFRVFGRSLRVAGHQPSLTVAGQPATIDLEASTESMLVATLPATAQPTEAATIASDNGNGTGTTSLEVPVAIEAGAGDPLDPEVGWSAGFSFAGHSVRAAALCDGTSDDKEPIAAAVKQAVKDGGGVVLLPAGICRLAGTVDLASKVILRGAGQDRTILRYEANVPIYAEGFDLVGLQDLQLLNAGPVEEGMVWQKNTRSVVQRVTLDMGKSRQWFVTQNRDFFFDHNIIKQSDSYNEQNPYRFDGSVGLVFSHNWSVNVAGSPTFQFVHDSVFLDNRFTRDARSQDESPVVAHHQFVVDFSYRIAIVGNRFDVINGPVTNKLRNDGETILVEGGGPLRTEQIGTVGQATARTLTDPQNVINVDPFKTGLPWNFAVAIVSGKGAGQARRVTGYRASTLDLDRDWDIVPDAQSHYATFVWGLEDTLIAGNTLQDNPRGIWLYQSSIRNVAVIGNTIAEGGGIFLRSFQNIGQHHFDVQLNTLVADNVITNSTRAWMSHIVVANVSSDPQAFGTGQIGIEVRRNRIVANTPNVTSTIEDYASQEGFVGLVRTENEGGQLTAVPNILGLIVQNNVCERCDKPYVTGTGSVGAVYADNQPGVDSPAGLTDMRMLGQRFGGSTATFKR